MFADVSGYQVPVDDSYPYQVPSIRVCDGTYQDHDFAANYAWMRTALDSGQITFGIVYTYVRSDWLGCPPFGQCNMNSADGLTPQQFAAACGITTNGDA
jgi:hypothetical protein